MIPGILLHVLKRRKVNVKKYNILNLLTANINEPNSHSLPIIVICTCTRYQMVVFTGTTVILRLYSGVYIGKNSIRVRYRNCYTLRQYQVYIEQKPSVVVYDIRTQVIVHILVSI